MIVEIAALTDNYIWIIHDQTNAIVIDPGVADRVQVYLDQHHLNLKALFLTHHHHDHIGGVADLLKNHAVPVYGPNSSLTPQVTHPLKEGESIEKLHFTFQVLSVAGHTLDHLAYFVSGKSLLAPALFCGDTLFSAGCGRLFEGTAQQMMHALDKVCQLPDETLVYCAHEYTLANLRFAKFCEPDNAMIDAWLKKATQLREQNRPTLPTTLALEKQINPFLRVDQPTIKKRIAQWADASFSDRIQVFKALRGLKDHF